MRSGTVRDGVLFLLAAFLLAWPWLPVREREGTDDQAQDLVHALAPDFQPWPGPVTAPGPTAERLLFGLQAGLGGAGLVLFGRRLVRHGRRGE